MSRVALIKQSRWVDSDWRALTFGAQWLYDCLLSSPTMSYCGVADWRPQRISQLAGGVDPAMVESWGGELVAARFVVIDWTTEEVWVRTFMRHDGVMRSPNIATAAVRAYDQVVSPQLRARISAWLRDYRARGDATLSRTAWERVQPIIDAFPEGFTEGLEEGSTEGLEEGIGARARAQSPLPLSPFPLPQSVPCIAPTTKAARSTYPADFEAFWADWPLRRGKGAAAKAWTLAKRRATVDEIMAGFRAQLPHLQAQAGRGYCPMASTWLTQSRWDDDADAPVAGPISRTQETALQLASGYRAPWESAPAAPAPELEP